MKNKNTHAILLTLVGGYILYIAYLLLEKHLSGTNEMAPALAIAFVAFFALGGAAVLVYAWRCWKEAKEEEKNPQNEADDDEDSLK